MDYSNSFWKRILDRSASSHLLKFYDEVVCSFRSWYLVHHLIDRQQMRVMWKLRSRRWMKAVRLTIWQSSLTTYLHAAQDTATCSKLMAGYSLCPFIFVLLSYAYFSCLKLMLPKLHKFCSIGWHWIHDQQVPGSLLTHCTIEYGSGQAAHTHV